MPAPWGVTPTGFSLKTFEEIRDGINVKIRNSLGFTPTDRDAIGVMVAAVSAEIASGWEVTEVTYEALDPDAAAEDLLENVSLITGTLRRQAAASTATLTLTGDPGTVVLAGARVKSSELGSVLEPGGEDDVRTTIFFATNANSPAFSAADAWATSTGYTIGDFVTANGNVYVCVDAGNSAGSGSGPDGEADGIVDNGVIWDFVGVGTAYAQVAASCTVTGAITALAGDLETIDSGATSGWDGVTNLLDADLGYAEDADQDLRLRRDADLARLGSTPVDPLRSELLDVEGVTAVKIFTNVNDTPLLIVDDGPDVTLPPHSVEALVIGGNDQDIRDALLRGVAAGTRTFGFPGGNVTGTAIDSAGDAWEIEFARPSSVDIYVAVTLTYDPDLYPEDGDDQVELAVVTFGDSNSKIGRDAIASAISAAIFRDVPGVVDCTVTVDVAPSPALSAVSIGGHQVASYDTSRVDVTSTEE